MCGSVGKRGALRVLSNPENTAYEENITYELTQLLRQKKNGGEEWGMVINSRNSCEEDGAERGENLFFVSIMQDEKFYAEIKAKKFGQLIGKKSNGKGSV